MRIEITKKLLQDLLNMFYFHFYKAFCLSSKTQLVLSILAIGLSSTALITSLYSLKTALGEYLINSVELINLSSKML